MNSTKQPKKSNRTAAINPAPVPMASAPAAAADHRKAERNRRRREATKQKHEVVAKEMAAALRDLEKLNYWLVQLGHPKQPSKQLARRELKNVFISIVDLVDEKFDQKKETLAELRKYLRTHRDRIFPLAQAKSQDLKLFLKKVF